MKHFLWLVPFLILSCTAGNGGTPSNQEPYITISGTVLNALNNAPIEDATVIAGNQTTQTNSSGFYSIQVTNSNPFDVFGVWKSADFIVQPLMFFNWEKPEEDTIWNLKTNSNGSDTQHTFEILIKDRDGNAMTSQDVQYYITNALSNSSLTMSEGIQSTDGEGKISLTENGDLGIVTISIYETNNTEPIGISIIESFPSSTIAVEIQQPPVSEERSITVTLPAGKNAMIFRVEGEKEYLLCKAENTSGSTDDITLNVINPSDLSYKATMTYGEADTPDTDDTQLQDYRIYSSNSNLDFSTGFPLPQEVTKTVKTPFTYSDGTLSWTEESPNPPDGYDIAPIYDASSGMGHFFVKYNGITSITFPTQFIDDYFKMGGFGTGGEWGVIISSLSFSDDRLVTSMSTESIANEKHIYFRYFSDVSSRVRENFIP